MLANVIEYLLGLDKVIWTWGFKKCAEFGAVFYLGAFEGFVIYAFVIIWGILLGCKINNGNKKEAKAK